MTKTDEGTVLSRKEGAVTVLTLSYPRIRNAVSLALREVLFDKLSEAMADETCRVIVMHGEGGHFSSGGDITSFDGVTPPAGRVRLQKLHRSIKMMVTGEKPVIAAVEGHAAGAGLCLAAACDVVVAARDSKLSCTFNKIGLTPDAGGLWTLPMRMGMGRAKLVTLSGRAYSGEEGERMGLVDQLAEPGAALEDALALAQDMAKLAPLSLAMTKSILSRAPQGLDQLLAAEADAQGVCYGSEDFHEGRTAFLEKRKPDFKGK